ncbi:MAG: type II secretion system F family protein [Pseudomonadota bacterium]
MPRFAYKAYTAEGRIARGQITATDEAAVLDALGARSLVAFDITPAGTGGDVPWSAREFSLTGDTVPRKELSEFLSIFALMLRSRMGVLPALRSSMEDVRNRRLRALLQEAERAVEEGGRISTVLSERIDIVPGRITQLIRLGEDADQMAETTGYAAEMMERELAFRSEISAALTYPVILLVASVAVMAGLVFLLAPTLAPVFAGVGAEPPWVIAAMLSVRTFALESWPVLLAALAALVAGTAALIASKSAALERLWLRIPYFGGLRRMSESLNGLRSLALMLQSGAPLLAAISTASDSCGMRLFRDLFDRVAGDVRSGASLADALRDDQLLPPAARRMLSAGEQSDHLGDTLRSTVATLDAQLRLKIQSGLRLLTPILTLVIGVVVGGMIFSTLTAILDLNDLAF